MTLSLYARAKVFQKQRVHSSTALITGFVVATSIVTVGCAYLPRRNSPIPTSTDSSSTNNHTSALKNRKATESGEGIIQKGYASFYDKSLHGNGTASGDSYHNDKFTAAHRTLPFGTKVKVTNLANGKHVMVTVNDRGPWVKGRIIDLSYCAAEKIGMVKGGVAHVSIQPASTASVRSKAPGLKS